MNKRPNPEQIKDSEKTNQGLGVVYLYKAVGSDTVKVGEKRFLCKIGYTKNTAEKRCRQLQTGMPYELLLLGQIVSTEYKKVEKELHMRYKDRKHQREWFWLTLEIIADLYEGDGMVYTE